MPVMSARVTGTPASNRISTQSKPFSFGERAQPGAPSKVFPPSCPIRMRLPGSTGMPKCSMRPPAASIAAGITSRRSAIAEAPNTITSSAPSRSTSAIAARSLPSSCTTRRSATMLAPAGASRSCVIFRVLSITLSDRPGSNVETMPTFLTRYGATRISGFASPAIVSAVETAPCGTANGMIFTVPIISPATTGLKAGSVAKVTASSIRLSASIASLSTTRTPALSANRLHRPVNARSIVTPSPPKAAAMRAAASSSPMSPVSMRATTTSAIPAAFIASISRAPMTVPFLSTKLPCRIECTAVAPSASAMGTAPNLMTRLPAGAATPSPAP